MTREAVRVPFEPDPDSVKCSVCDWIGPADVFEAHVCFVDSGDLPPRTPSKDAHMLLDSYERNKDYVAEALRKAGYPLSWWSAWGRTLRRLVKQLDD